MRGVKEGEQAAEGGKEGQGVGVADAAGEAWAAEQCWAGSRFCPSPGSLLSSVQPFPVMSDSL